VGVTEGERPDVEVARIGRRMVRERAHPTAGAAQPLGDGGPGIAEPAGDEIEVAAHWDLAARKASQMSGRSRPRSGTVRPWVRAQARTSAVVGSGAGRGPAGGSVSSSSDAAWSSA